MIRLLHNKIREARLEARISVIGLARELNLNRQQIHRIEAGRSAVSVEQLCRIAELTNKRMAWFFDEDDIEDRMVSTKADIRKILSLLTELKNSIMSP